MTYDLTALTPEGETELDRFASGYQREIREWQDAIHASLPGESAVNLEPDAGLLPKPE